MADRWHCFASQAGGDAISFAEAFAGVGFTAALEILEGRGALTRGADPHLHIRPVTRFRRWACVGRGPRVGGKRLALLGPESGACTRRLRGLPLLSLDGLTAMARRRLSQRAVDITALEDRERRPLAGSPEAAEREMRSGSVADPTIDAWTRANAEYTDGAPSRPGRRMRSRGASGMSPSPSSAPCRT